MKRTIIIAEAGVNHNGSLEIAKKLVDVAEMGGADYVKFQTFKTSNIVNEKSPKAKYQLVNSPEETQYEMLKKLELDLNKHKELINYCKQKTVKFLSTPFDSESVDMLYELGIRLFKIPSGEITNIFLLEKISKLRDIEIIISTGMCNLYDIENALTVLLSNGISKENIRILHCNTQYPTPIEDVNLNAMKTIKEKFLVDVGYSDHTEGIIVALAAVSMGACVIEKHFTLDKNMKGPDHKASLNPVELTDMIDKLRMIELSLGSKEKKITNSELENITIARKSLFLKTNIKKGQTLKKSHFTAKRPGDGISPMDIKEVILKKAIKDLKIDDKLKWTDIEL